MLQEERKIPVGSVTSSTTSSLSSDMSVIHHKNKVELIQDYFDEAKKFVSRALKLDEMNDRMTALDMYNKALNSIKSGLNIIRSSPQVTSTMNEIKKKMEKLKDQVKSRMEVLLEEQSRTKSSSPRTGSSTDSYTVHKTVGSITSVGMKTSDGRPSGDTVGAEADLIFSSSTGCKVIRVNKDGIILKCTTADSLNIFKYKQNIPGQPPAFLQCGDFVYPLIPGQSPILRSSYKAYVFPDPEAMDNSGNVGVMFNELPNEELKQLNIHFSALSNFKVSGEEGNSTGGTINERADDGGDTSDDKSTPTWGNSLSEKIDAGVTWVSGAISSGTSKAGELLNKGGNKVRDNIEPRKESVEIPQPVEKGFYYTRKVSGAVVGVSDFLMMTLAKGTVIVGKKIGSAVVESDMMKEREINPHAIEAWKVTKSSVKGAGHVFSDLEIAAKAIIKGAGQETSKTVGHRYGDQAGRITDDGLSTAGNAVDLASTYWNWKTWGISFIGKVGKVLATKDDEEKEKDIILNNDTPPVVDSQTNSISSSASHTVPKPKLHVKPKKELST